MTKVHPPFDPDVAAALTAVNEILPSSITPDLIGRVRDVTEAGTLGLDEIRRHVRAEEHSRRCRLLRGDEDPLRRSAFLAVIQGVKHVNNATRGQAS